MIYTFSCDGATCKGKVGLILQKWPALWWGYQGHIPSYWVCVFHYTFLPCRAWYMVKMLSVSISFTYLVQVWVLCLCYLSMYACNQFQVFALCTREKIFPCLHDTVLKNFVYLLYLYFFFSFSFFLFLSGWTCLWRNLIIYFYIYTAFSWSKHDVDPTWWLSLISVAQRHHLYVPCIERGCISAYYWCRYIRLCWACQALWRHHCHRSIPVPPPLDQGKMYVCVFSIYSSPHLSFFSVPQK